MIIPEKTITENPFVDNILYYSKLMALNCTVKDEAEALSQETAESLRRRELLISSVEKTATYEVYDSIPKEIIEKNFKEYKIEIKTNLDVYAKDIESLKTYMNSYSLHERTKMLDRMSALARVIYANHYEIMMEHLYDTQDKWDEYNSLYNECNKTENAEVIFKKLFNVLPAKTVYRIINTYLGVYGNIVVDSIASDIKEFEAFMNFNNNHITYADEIYNIIEAMKKVFISHYEIIINRGYIKNHNTNPSVTWKDYIKNIGIYKKCKLGFATYDDLYITFPEEELLDSLNTIFGNDIVEEYGLMRDVEVLNEYIKKYDLDGAKHALELNANMSAKYLDNYNMYINNDIYGLCLSDAIDLYELYDYLPVETRKLILGYKYKEKDGNEIFIKEISNVESYYESKKLFNSFLNTLDVKTKLQIKDSITKDMQEWYPAHYEELNNYYRAIIGLPPLDEDGNPMVDTLVHSWNNENKQFKELGSRFIKTIMSHIDNDVYPEIHWKQEIHNFDAYDIGILNQYNILNDWAQACGADLNSPRYRYLKYLGDNKLDIYTCSRAMNFQLIGIPTIDDLDFKRKFIDAFVVNRDYVIRTVYSDAHKFQSDYYDKFIIIFILVNTIMDCLLSIPDYIIDREIFDSRCIKYLFESFGIPYYSEIPLKYQKAMLKNLNTLIKYKSSTRNMVDICSLFGFSDVKVFGYYLFKQRLVDPSDGQYKFKENNMISYKLEDLYVRDKTGTIKDYNGVRYTKLLEYRNYDEAKYIKTITIAETDKGGNVIYDENGNLITRTEKIINNDADVYLLNELEDGSKEFIPFKDADYFTKIAADTDAIELKFIKVPVNGELSEYKNDPDYIVPYDEMVTQDEGDTWNGGEDHNLLYNKLLDHEFNAVKTKYISVETVTEMTDLSFQVSYFYNMLFDNMYSEDMLTVQIPHLKIDHNFRFMDIVCYLFALMYLYNGLNDNIMYSPTQILYIKGYNFNEDLNEVLKDAKAFTQKNPVTEELLKDSEKENIFDINTRITEDGYDYREEFNKNNYTMKAFNLECDIDALEKWLNDNFQMSLDDFIVEDYEDRPDLTLRHFFSLNNSYYQRNVFKSGYYKNNVFINTLLPEPYNQDIKGKFAFDYLLSKKEIKADINENELEYIKENNLMEVVTNSSDIIYIKDYNYFINYNNYDYAIYYKYTRQEDGNYKRDNNTIYYRNHETEDSKTGIREFKRLFTDKIAIIDKFGNYVFASDAYYTKSENNDFVEIPYKKYSESFNADYDKIFKFGEFYIKNANDEWIIDPTRHYVQIKDKQTGEIHYELVGSDGYENTIIPEDQCYIRHSDGHFINLTETDYYIKKESGEEYNGYVYTEEDCYVITDKETEYYDESVNPRVYYTKLDDYYSENGYIVSSDYYVKDNDGNMIPSSELIDPNNCYYEDDKGNKILVIDTIGRVEEYTTLEIPDYTLILQDNNEYLKFEKIISNNDVIYTEVIDIDKQYIYNSDTEYLTILIKNANYDTSKSMIVIFNKPLDSNSNIIDPDEFDKVNVEGNWDEGDWYYNDTYDGEHTWFNEDIEDLNKESEDEPEEEKKSVGSGFVLLGSSYLNEPLVEGKTYYISLDIETNFTGNIQMVCDADNNPKIYSVTQGERLHIIHTFVANDKASPSLRFLIYDYHDNPIEIGDFVIISNIKVIRAYSDNYIAQDIPSYDRLQELYRTNEKIYKYLVGLMAETDDLYTYNIYKKLYDSLMISKYNKEAFKIGENKYAKTYTDFLETRDAVLYEKLCYFKSLDRDAMSKQIADDIVEVTYAIDDCIDTYSYGYLYSYFPAVSASYIQQYIIKIINFFKSWKVHLLGINTVYKFDDKLENTIKILERNQERIRIDSIKGNIFTYGCVKINPIDATNVSGEKYTDVFPDLVEYSDELQAYYSHRLDDQCTIHDRVRIMSTTANKLDHFYDTDGDLMLRLNEETANVAMDENENLIIKSNRSEEYNKFNIIDDNIVIMTTDEDEHEVFAIQKIGEINSNSIDINDMKK